MNKVVKILLGLLTVFILIVYYIFFYAPKVHFAEEDLIWFDVYEVGDTLIFQNLETKMTDTTLITNKRIRHYEYDWFLHDGYRPISAELSYKNNNLKYAPNHQGVMIAREKNKPKDYVDKSISYLYSVFDIKESDFKIVDIILSTNKRTFKQVYVFKNKKHRLHKPKDDSKPQTLYWDEKYGIIKYETFSGEVWERVNW